MRLRLTPAAVVLFGMALAARSQTLVGIVEENKSGSPLASAEIRVWKSGAPEAVAETQADSEGKFQIPGLISGNYRVQAAKPNYTTTSLRLRLEPNSRPVRLCLVRLGSISGQVSDQEGRPVSDAYVFAIRSHQNVHERASTRVNNDGSFRIHSLSPGHYLVAVSYGASTMAVGSRGNGQVIGGPGSGTLFYPDNARPKDFVVSEGEELESIDFVITRGTLSTVSGRVEANPEAGRGKSWVTFHTPDLLGLSVATVETETDGTYHLGGIPPGSYTLLASGPASSRGPWGGILGPEPFFGRVTLVVSAENTGDVSIPMQPGRSASFVLVAPQAAQSSLCAAKVSVTLAPVADWGSSLETRFDLQLNREKRVEHLAPGQYRVTTKAEGDLCFGQNEMVVDLNQPMDHPFQIAIVPAASIHGKLNGATGTGTYPVILFDPDSIGGQTLQETIPDSEGRFEFNRLRPGSYTVSVRQSGMSGVSVEVNAEAGVTANVELTIPPPEDSQ